MKPVILPHTRRDDDPPEVKRYLFQCPGCGCGHSFETPKWKFNGDMHKPTLQPSYLTWWGGMAGGKYRHKKNVCHSYITDGKIRFLTDCTHALAGKTVALEPF